MPLQPQIRILIAGEHSIFREGLCKLLETDEGFSVIGETLCDNDMLEVVSDARPDVLLLDISIPFLPSLEILRRLSKFMPSLHTIVLTGPISKSQMLQALLSGARGIVSKQAASRLLFKSIRTVMAGEFWISRSIVADLLQILRANPRFTADSESSALTRRELDIIAAVVEGQVNRDIAQTFQISEYTVKHHLTRIFEKLGVSNRVELAMYAVNHDLVTWSRASSPMKAQ